MRIGTSQTPPETVILLNRSCTSASVEVECRRRIKTLALDQAQRRESKKLAGVYRSTIEMTIHITIGEHNGDSGMLAVELTAQEEQASLLGSLLVY